MFTTKAFTVICLAMSLVGCAIVPIPETSDLEEFTPSSKHMIDAPKIKHVVVNDVAAHCAKLTSTPNPTACAQWSKTKKTCTVYTGKTTTHVYLGHEVRHCFEGDFH